MCNIKQADGFVLKLVITYSIPERYSIDRKHRSAKEIPYLRN